LPSTQEQHARVEIDRLPAAPGRQVCGLSYADISGVRGVVMASIMLVAREKVLATLQQIRR
jgi:hypothetical protein